MTATSDSGNATALCGLARISRSSLLAAFATAATVCWLPGVARAEEARPDSTGAASWWGVAADLSWPLGSFDPPGDTPNFGLGAHLTFHPGHSRIGVRLEYGMTTNEVQIDSVLVDSGIGFASYETVRAGNDLWWFMIGAVWDPRPHATSAYAFADLGVLHVNPEGVAGNRPIVRPEVPGLPPSSNTFAYDVGVGTRLMLLRQLGLNAEVEYLYGGDAAYVGSVGVEGSSPTRYASRNSSIGLFVVRLGLVRRL